MKECPNGSEYLLTADLGSPEVQDHVRACAVCREGVRRITEAHVRLDEALGAPPARPIDPEAIVRRARLREVAGPSSPRLGRVVVALAAAAVVTLLLLRLPERPLPGRPPPAATLAPPDVEATGRSFAVLPTRDPDITVVWFYE